MCDFFVLLAQLHLKSMLRNLVIGLIPSLGSASGFAHEVNKNKANVIFLVEIKANALYVDQKKSKCILQMDHGDVHGP